VETLRRYRENLKTTGELKNFAPGEMDKRSGHGRVLTAIAALIFLTVVAALIFAELVGSPIGARTDAPPTKPILRLNTTAHTAPIHGIATDRENRFAVTASEDKTARVWSLPDGRLLSVLRVPIDYSDMGKLYAVAMTQDGATVAVGGFTGISRAEKSIYLFDRASGAMRRRLSGLPNTANHLAYSADGRLLAAALGGPNGIRVYDAGNEYQLLPSDKNYGDSAYYVDFDKQGRLVTTSFDGFIRLYGASHYDVPTAKVKGRGGNRPALAVFSPDGQRVAVVGLDDGAVLDVLSGKDLAFVQAANTSDAAGPNMQSTAWSIDGRYLFAGDVANRAMVRRWENAGSGQHIDIETANDRVMELLPLNDGGTLLATADPAFGIIDSQGRAKILQGPGQFLFRDRLGSLRVSREGKTVEQGTDFPQHLVRFMLAERRLDIDPSADSTLTAPVTEARDLKVTGWKDDYHPALNGRPIALDDREKPLSLALMPGNDGFVLGTEWSVRRFDRDGQLVWRKPVPGVTWGVNVTPDGRLVVSAFGDGTIRWWRADNGRELLALFVHPDLKRWIAWTPQGYFDASVGADELIGWHVNHGFDKTPDFFPVSRFRDRFYRQDVIAKVLDTLDVDEAVRQADEVAERMTAKAAPITQTLPPVVQIAEPAQGVAFTATELKVTYSARASADDPVTRVQAQIDGRKTAGLERVLSAAGDTRIGIITIELPRRDATVSVIAYNKHGASEPASVQTIWAGHGIEPKPKLYILAIGVSNYQDQSLNLHYPTKDAEDFVRTMSDHAAGLYEGVIARPPPADGKWTIDAVLDGLDWIRKEPTNKDVAIVFISGHGTVTPDQIYRFLPYDYDRDRIERTTVRSADFQDFLSKIGGKVLVFLDTCYSGDVLRGGKAPPASQDKFANELAAAENGAVVFTSSSGNQLSWEDPTWGNGAFTKALVEGLGGKADRANIGVVRVLALADYVYDRVKDMTDGKQKPLVAEPRSVENIPIVVVSN
jgi:WD40 repeat protein